MALLEGRRALHGPYPERRYLEVATRVFDTRRSRTRSTLAAGVLAGLALGAGVALTRTLRRSRAT